MNGSLGVPSIVIFLNVPQPPQSTKAARSTATAVSRVCTRIFPEKAGWRRSKFPTA
jgi:hypothetical protein